jgi:tetratricopeptide (TPR) repeat protein
MRGLVLGLNPSTPMNHKQLERTLNEACRLHRAGQLAEAVALYAQARRAAPMVYDCWYLAGTLELHRDCPAEAIPLLTRALQLARGGPAAAQCRLFLGMAYADAGRPAEAVAPLRAALAKHPGYDEAWEALAGALLALGRQEEAADCLQGLLDLKPGRVDIRERLEELRANAVPTELAGV